MRYSFTAKLWYWRGPAPFYFVTIPSAIAAEIHDHAAQFTYGWGMIPVEGTVAGVACSTSLFAKDGGYVMPIKKAVRVAAGLDDDDEVAISIAPVRPGS